MSPVMLFVLLLIIGILSLKTGVKTEKKTKVIFITIGIIILIVAVFGLLTVFL